MEQQQEVNQAPETESSGADSRPGAGAVLREARERMGMSVEEVALRLKFAPRQIVALEEENFSQLPEPAFVRGFVRSYARLMQIEAEPLLEALPGAPVREAPSIRKPKEDVIPHSGDARKQNLIWLAGALAIALIMGVLVWKYDSGETSARPAPVAKSGTDAAPASGVQPGEAASAVAPAVPVLAAAPAPKQTGKRAAAPASAVAAAPKENGVRKNRTAHPVRLEFVEDSWVEVTDGNGKILLSLVGKQGSSHSVSGTPPLSVTIGNAKGVKLFYKDEPVDLGAQDGQDVARLKLE
jgi:cytoskeleton protein RodZ